MNGVQSLGQKRYTGIQKIIKRKNYWQDFPESKMKLLVVLILHYIISLKTMAHG